MRNSTHDRTPTASRAFDLVLVLFFLVAGSAMTLGCDRDADDDVLELEPNLEYQVEDEMPAASEDFEALDEGDQDPTWVPTTPALPADTDESMAQSEPLDEVEAVDDAVIVFEPLDDTTRAQMELETIREGNIMPRGAAQYDVDDAERELDDPMAGDDTVRGSAQFDLPSDDESFFGEAIIEEADDDAQAGFEEVARNTRDCPDAGVDRTNLTLPVSLQTALADPMQYTGLSVQGEVEVLEAVTDRGFWVERPNGERLFVLLKEKHEHDERIHVQDGQRVKLDGVLLSASAVDILAGDVDPDSRKIIDGLDVFLATPYMGVEIVERPSQN